MNTSRERNGLPSGFQASIDGANLADLVQMRCLAGAREAVRVTSENGVGYLYFEGGRVIHAVTADHAGVDAVARILSWNAGTFEVCQAAWPSKPSIEIGWQQLLLSAATTQDEEQHSERNAGTLLPFPNSRTAMTPPDTPQSGPVDLELELGDDAPGSTTERGRLAVDAAVRLSLSGEIQFAKGEGASELAEVAAYVVRLGEVVGQLAGLGDFVSITASSRSQQCLVARRRSSVVAMLAEQESDIRRLKEKLGIAS